EELHPRVLVPQCLDARKRLRRGMAREKVAQSLKHRLRHEVVVDVDDHPSLPIPARSPNLLPRPAQRGEGRHPYSILATASRAILPTNHIGRIGPMVMTLDAPPAYEVQIQDVEYRRNGDKPLLATMYVPKGAGPFPAVVDIHGGAWTSKDRTDN